MRHFENKLLVPKPPADCLTTVEQYCGIAEFPLAQSVDTKMDPTLERNLVPLIKA